MASNFRASGYRILLLVCLLGGVWQAQGVTGNHSGGHPSPYVAMHGNDPVDWRIWGPPALQQAQRDNRLIYLSIGYFSCYWCHVMQRESFQNQAIAKLLNDDYVSVVVDRELNPALDQAMMRYVEATRGYGGWPLNVILTPDGNPLIGAVYLPPEQLQLLLSEVAGQWRNNEAGLRAIGAQAREQLATTRVAPDLLPLPVDGKGLGVAFWRQASELADDISGGFGEQGKFPSVPQLRTLLKLQQNSPDPELEAFLLLTLRAMASQGLRDQIGGGFFRYTEDPTWEIPHYEKMLYDNAMLADLYLRAAQVLRQPWLQVVGLDTLDFMLRDMATPEGGLVASLSAVDGEGVEGRYYLWDAKTIDDSLDGRQRQVVNAVWGLDVDEGGDGVLPRWQQDSGAAARQLGLSLDELDSLLQSSRSRLLQVREQRQLPVDSKVLSGWNGLALSALARASMVEGGQRYAVAATRLRDHLVAEFWDGERLARVGGDGKDGTPGSLEDYAYLARGLLDRVEFGGGSGDLDLVAEIISQGWRRHRSAGGWRLSETMLVPLAADEPVLTDGALPSPSAVLLGVALRLSTLRQDALLYSEVIKAARQGATELQGSPYFYASQIALLMDIGGDSTD